MLDVWLSTISVQAFTREYLRRIPYAQPSTAQNALQLFGWDTLERILVQHPNADILVVGRNSLMGLPPPRNLTEAHALMSQGVGLVVRRAEKHDSGLAKLAELITHDIPGEVHIQLFVTPCGTYGFGWHYDDEDVFIAQTAGAKDYFFRKNTVECFRSSGTAPDFGRFIEETSPICSARLVAGDWLYIPSRWWHVAKCVEDSLSISLGVSVSESWLATRRY